MEAAQQEFKNLTRDFGFLDSEISKILQKASEHEFSYQKVDALEPFLGLEKSQAFVEKHLENRNEAQLKLQGIWKNNGFDVIQLLGNLLKNMDASVEAPDLLEQLKQIPSHERKDYLISLFGEGFEVERIAILISKQEQTEMRQKMELETRQAKKEKEKHSKSQNKASGLPLAKVGSKTWCECQATFHSLRGNCPHCGKILCEYDTISKFQGLCAFCDVPLAGEVDSVALAAMERMETLVEYQKKVAAGPMIHDEAVDFDIGANHNNLWLSNSDLAIAQELLRRKEMFEEEQKRKRLVTIDLQKKRVFEEERPKFQVGKLQGIVEKDQFYNHNLKHRRAKAKFIPSLAPKE